MGTYAIIYLKKPEMAKEVNNLLKEKYNLTYESYNGIEYGIFFTQEMFDEDLIIWDCKGIGNNFPIPFCL